MLRYSVCIFRNILKPRVSYSTSTSEKVKKPTPLITKLLNEFDDISPIIDIIRDEDLNNINFEEWKSRISVLQKYHFSDVECFKMISAYPNILKIPLEILKYNLKLWYSAELGLNNYHYLFLNQPQVLDINPEDFRKRLPQLRIYFKKTESFCNLLVNCPNVMHDNLKSVLEKMNYLVKVRRFNINEVIESEALSKSMNFIQFRFDLLEKCGIYKQDHSPLHKTNKYDKTKHKNPSLKEILNVNKVEFSKVAKISVEEYEVCKNLFLELQEDEDEDEEEEENGYN